MSIISDCAVSPVNVVMPAAKAAIRTDVIVAGVGAEQWVLSGGVGASRALSCLVEPEVGDRVLVVTEDRETIILSILHRSHAAATNLSAVGRGSVSLKSREVSIIAERGISLEALTSIRFLAPLGVIQSLSESLMQTVKGSLVSIANSVFNKAEHYELNVKESIVTRAKMQSINAQSELFMDAKRINMG